MDLPILGSNLYGTLPPGHTLFGSVVIKCCGVLLPVAIGSIYIQKCMSVQVYSKHACNWLAKTLMHENGILYRMQ